MIKVFNQTDFSSNGNYYEHPYNKAVGDKVYYPSEVSL